MTTVQVELPPGDLSATSPLNKSLQLLQEILSSHDSSSVTPDERKQTVAQVNVASASFVCHELHLLTYFWSLYDI